MVDELDRPRAIIEKIQKSTAGLNKILQQAENSKKIDISRVWRLAYYLKGKKLKDENKDAEVRKIFDEIIKQYEKLIFGVLKGEKVNPLLVSVAARWAEFETRKKIESEQET